MHRMAQIGFRFSGFLQLPYRLVGGLEHRLSVAQLRGRAVGRDHAGGGAVEDRRAAGVGHAEAVVETPVAEFGARRIEQVAAEKEIAVSDPQLREQRGRQIALRAVGFDYRRTALLAMP